MRKTLRLGLIGGNITESRSPALQIICGLSVGLNVSYDLLIPAEQHLSFVELMQRCGRLGFDGANVTYPHKEQVLKHATPGELVVATLGASNTVRFLESGPRCYNTDYTGFIAAYRAKWGGTAAGRVLLIGTGGVGRAIAFALVELGASEILLHDLHETKAEALSNALLRHAGAKTSCVSSERLRDLTGIDGVINCTPLGMSGRPGSPLPQEARGGIVWAFDAVYTPEETLFRGQTVALGADFLSGYELYFHQGIQGFRTFSGVEVTDLDWVRRVLAGNAGRS